MTRAKYLEFGIPQRCYQGSGSVSKLREILDVEGWKRVLLVAGPHLYGSGALDPVLEGIRAAGADFAAFTNIKPNPDAAAIDGEAIPLYLEYKPDVIVAAGGGSTLDTAKGIAIAAESGRKVLEFTIDKLAQHAKIPHRTPPMIAIPTTAGTGSEVGANAVINSDDGEKLVLRHDSIVPAYALMDPDFLAGLPFAVAAATAMDTFVQALETLTNRNANDFTRVCSLRSLELAGRSIRAFVADPSDPVHADNMSLACMWAGFPLGLAGIGQDHVLTHPMGEAPFHMPHGDACGMALPAVVEYNGLACRDLYRQAYNALTGERLPSSAFDVRMLIDWCVALNDDLHIAQDRSLEDWGYNDGDVLERMLAHPIVRFAVARNAPPGETEYPRRTTIEDYRAIIRRIAAYSREQAERARERRGAQ
jgi:alcohol dehydrogenase class IV